MSSFTDQPIGYLSIQHLASIAEKKTTEDMLLNPSAKELLTREDWEELNFSNVHIFIHHVELAPREVYNSVMKFRKQLVLVDKQNQKLKSKFTNYKKANKAYVIDNVQLKAKNNDLQNWLADLEKQLEIARLNKRPTPLSLLLPLPSVSDDSDGNSKHSYHHSQKAKSIKLPDPSILTDGHVVEFNINVWESKMAKKLAANADHYPTEVLRMAYVDSRVDGEAYKHLAAKSKISAWKSFATAEEMFEVLQKAYGNVNRAHTAMNKFWDLKMTKDFNSFWAKFRS